MTGVFPDPIQKLPCTSADCNGVCTHLVQGENCQVLFMECDRDIILPEHKHEAQWGVVLEGRVDFFLNGVKHTCVKGDRYYIPCGVSHSGRIYAGYADMVFYDQKDRCKQVRNNKA
jgi:quercetin dioxygenase-like cupin family protein